MRLTSTAGGFGRTKPGGLFRRDKVRLGRRSGSGGVVGVPGVEGAVAGAAMDNEAEVERDSGWVVVDPGREGTTTGGRSRAVEPSDRTGGASCATGTAGRACCRGADGANAEDGWAVVVGADSWGDVEGGAMAVGCVLCGESTEIIRALGPGRLVCDGGALVARNGKARGGLASCDRVVILGPLGAKGELGLAFEGLVPRTPGVRVEAGAAGEAVIPAGSDGWADDWADGADVVVGTEGVERPAQSAEGVESMLAEAYVDIVCSLGLRLRSQSSVEVVVIVVGVVVLVRATDSG